MEVIMLKKTILPLFLLMSSFSTVSYAMEGTFHSDSQTIVQTQTMLSEFETIENDGELTNFCKQYNFERPNEGDFYLDKSEIMLQISSKPVEIPTFKKQIFKKFEPFTGKSRQLVEKKSEDDEKIVKETQALIQQGQEQSEKYKTHLIALTKALGTKASEFSKLTQQHQEAIKYIQSTSVQLKILEGQMDKAKETLESQDAENTTLKEQNEKLREATAILRNLFKKE